MREIRMIKESDLFDWKVGDEFEVNMNGVAYSSGDWTTIESCAVRAAHGYPLGLFADEVVKLGYAEWVEEEPEKIEKIEGVKVEGGEIFIGDQSKINELIEAVNKLQEDIDLLIAIRPRR